MKYYTTEITTVDGQTAVATFERADKNAAMSSYHSTMASVMANDKCTDALCLVFDSNGGIYVNDHWNRQG